jgi:acetylornithine deacetylase
VDDRVIAPHLIAQHELIGTLAELIRIPSLGGTPAESDIVHHVAGRLRDEGVEVDEWRIPLDDLAARPDFPGVEVERSEAWSVVARVPGGDGPSLMFNAHLDVVPPGDRQAWDEHPFSGRISSTDVYGRGACDMKGGAVAALFALLAVHRSGLRPAGDLLFAGVVGEEDGGLGTYATLARGWRADACVIPEPTGLDVLAANGGALTFRLRVPGRAVHASMRRRGVSAIEKFQPVFTALRSLEAARNADVDPMMARWDLAYPLEVGTLRAGDWSSTVPDLLIAEGRYGVALDEPVDDARRVFEETIADVDASVSVEWWGGQFASGRCPAGSDLVPRVLAAHGGRAEVYGAPYGSDLRLLAAAGIPTVQYGPGAPALAHSPAERVPIGEVRHCAEALIRMVSPDGYLVSPRG